MNPCYQVYEDGSLFLVYFCLHQYAPDDDKVLYYQIPPAYS